MFFFLNLQIFKGYTRDPKIEENASSSKKTFLLLLLEYTLYHLSILIISLTDRKLKVHNEENRKEIKPQ